MASSAWAAGLRSWMYRSSRNTYQRLLNRREWRERTALRELLRPYVVSGALAFDVGANVGHHSETCRELGARVIAVEANPKLADVIRQRFSGITVEGVALGSTDGIATLRIGRDTAHSTVSDEWAKEVPDRWESEVIVPMTTLDVLIDKYGVPAFVKIDVEGYEGEVLEGLSHAVRAVMFEFLTALPHVTRHVVGRLLELGAYEFCIAGEPWGMHPISSSGSPPIRGAQVMLSRGDSDPDLCRRPSASAIELRDTDTQIATRTA